MINGVRGQRVVLALICAIVLVAMARVGFAVAGATSDQLKALADLNELLTLLLVGIIGVNVNVGGRK